MPCFHPIEAWRTTEITSTGKKAIAFKKSATAISQLKLPCGRCIGCKLTRSKMWAIRSVHEAQLHQTNSFITLTYSDEHLPTDGSLIKYHFQDFMKRLRKQSQHPIRYYMCGEYGDKLSRPHYHACLFGHDFQDKEIHKDNEGILLYTSEKLEKIWNKGFCTVGDVNFETAAYTARYITKKVTGDQAQDHYTTTCPTTGELIHLCPEYTTMSRRPGLAFKWYEQYKSDIYPSDFLVHQGKKIKVPRYYDNLYDATVLPPSGASGDNHEQFASSLEEIKLQRKKRARRYQQDNTPERLAVREKISLLNHQVLTRSYENQ